jgi:hypothetical protein
MNLNAVSVLKDPLFTTSLIPNTGSWHLSVPASCPHAILQHCTLDIGNTKLCNCYILPVAGRFQARQNYELFRDNGPMIHSVHGCRDFTF